LTHTVYQGNRVTVIVAGSQKSMSCIPYGGGLSSTEWQSYLLSVIETLPNYFACE